MAAVRPRTLFIENGGVENTVSIDRLTRSTSSPNLLASFYMQINSFLPAADKLIYNLSEEEYQRPTSDKFPKNT